MTFSTIMFWFTLYSMIGWVFETLFILIVFHRFELRGFLNIPLCPIYGFSALFMIILFYRKKYHWITIMIGCGIVVSVVEYVTSWTLEFLFGKPWWTYVDWPLNLNGRISLFTSLGFALGGLLLIKFLHPAISRFLNTKVSPRLRLIIGFSALGIIVADTIVTFLLEFLVR